MALISGYSNSRANQGMLQQPISPQPEIGAGTRSTHSLVNPGNRYDAGMTTSNPYGFTTVKSTNPDFKAFDYGSYTPTDYLGQFNDKFKAFDTNAWTGLMNAQQQSQQADALQQQAALGQGNLATARSGLAMRGGLSGGARERLAQSAARTGTMGAQDIRLKGIQDRLGIGSKAQEMSLADEASRRGTWAGLANSQGGQANDLYKFLLDQHIKEQTLGMQATAGQSLKDQIAGMAPTEVPPGVGEGALFMGADGKWYTNRGGIPTPYATAAPATTVNTAPAPGQPGGGPAPGGPQYGFGTGV